MSAPAKDNWKRRWFVIRVALFASILMALGLFVIDPKQAAIISGTIGQIAMALVALAASYAGVATWDDRNKRQFGSDDV